MYAATKSKGTRNTEDPDTKIIDKSLIPTFGAYIFLVCRSVASKPNVVIKLLSIILVSESSCSVPCFLTVYKRATTPTHFLNF